MSEVRIYGKELELNRDLTKKEIEWIDAKLGLFQKVSFVILKNTDLEKAKPEGWTGKATIALVRQNNKTRIGIRRPTGSIRWDG